MRGRVWRRVRWLLAGVLACGAVAVAAVVGASEWMLRRRHDEAPLPPSELLPTPTAAELEEGRRLAVIVGCWAGCHGMHGEGDDLVADGIFTIVAPTLSAVLPAYTDAELERLVRYGIKRDGRTALGMPAGTFYPLARRDLALIVAHLRRQPPTAPVARKRRITLLGRLALGLGKWQTSVDEVDPTMPRWGDLPQATPFERGRYLASITCSECHGLDFRGEPLEGSPSLVVARAYSNDQFRHLLRTGEGLEGRDLGMMSWVARNALVDVNYFCAAATIIPVRGSLPFSGCLSPAALVQRTSEASWPAGCGKRVRVFQGVWEGAVL